MYVGRENINESSAIHHVHVNISLATFCTSCKQFKNVCTMYIRTYCIATHSQAWFSYYTYVYTIGLRNQMKQQGMLLKTAAVIVEWIVTHIVSLTTHHSIKLTGYIELQRFVIAYLSICLCHFNLFILQLSMQLQQSSAYWSDKVRQLSSQLEEATPLHQWKLLFLKDVICFVNIIPIYINPVAIFHYFQASYCWSRSSFCIHVL